MSVVEAPKLKAFGAEQYPSLFEKAAVFLRNIIGDHPFIDGNKRTAVTVSGIFLHRNGKHLISSQKDLEDFTLRITTGHLEIRESADWLHDHTE
jgi:death-on-curing protein